MVMLIDAVGGFSTWCYSQVSVWSSVWLDCTTDQHYSVVKAWQPTIQGSTRLSALSLSHLLTYFCYC